MSLNIEKSIKKAQLYSDKIYRDEKNGVKYKKGWLNPVKPQQKDFKFLVADIEAMKWVNFLCVGLYDGDTFEHYTEFDSFYDAINLWAREFVEPKEKQVKMQCWKDGELSFEIKDVMTRSVPIFVHNGGRYDFNFFVKYIYQGNPDIYLAEGIPVGSSILLLKLHYRLSDHEIIEICFWDSTKLLPFGLKSLTEYFDVEHKKLEFDHTKTTGITPEMIHYLEHDCKGHYEVMDKFYNWSIIKHSPKGYTLASQSFNVFKTFIKNSIPPLNKSDDIFFRKGYYGGRTEIFKPIFDDPKRYLKAFDVNSLYPAMMRDSLICFEPLEGAACKFVDHHWGIWELDIEVPEMYIPPLPTIAIIGKTKKLIFPTGIIHGVWETNEIVYAMSLGCKIKKVYKGNLFRKGQPIFKEYVDFFYELRLQAKREGNTVNDLLAKLLLNNLYGRFALRKNREMIDEFSGAAGEKIIGDVDLGLLDFEGKTLRNFASIVSRPSTYEGYSNVTLSLQITANARINVHKRMMEAPHELYYTDTDSLYTTFDYKSDPTILGALKYEGKAHQACFVLPKTYVVMEEKEDEVVKKVRMKGFNMKSLEEEDREYLAQILKDLETKKAEYDLKGRKLNATDSEKFEVLSKKLYTSNINEFTFENFCNHLEGEQRLVNIQKSKFATFRSAVRKGHFVTMTDSQIKEIRSKYDKRFLYKTENGEFDSRPLHVVDGVAT